MGRGQQFERRLSDADVVKELKGFLAWLYGKHRTPEADRRAFWLWWSGLFEEQIRGIGADTFNNAVTDSGAWPFPEFRRRWLKALGAAQRGEQVWLPSLKYSLTKSSGRDGRYYFAVSPRLPRPWTPKAFAGLVLDEVLRFLDRLDVAVLGRCTECERLFLRLRTKRRQYCRQSCKQNAWLRAHAARERQPGRHKGVRKTAGARRRS